MEGPFHDHQDDDGGTWSHKVTSFFDFSSVATVNAALNSQGRSIDTGTCRYVRLEFCKYGPPTNNSDPNINWTYSTGSVTDAPLSQASCGVTRPIDPPIEVKAGDAVTITLAYTMDGTITTGTAPSCQSNYCFSLPTFTPSASK